MNGPAEPKHDPLDWAKHPRSQLAMDWLCMAIREDREVPRLLPILQVHVRRGHPFAGELARTVAQLDMRAAARGRPAAIAPAVLYLPA